MIAVLMVTLFLAAAFDRNLGAAHSPARAAVSTPLAIALAWMSPAAARAGLDASWWIHAHAPPRLPQLSAVLEAPARHRLAAEHLPLEHQRTRASSARCDRWTSRPRTRAVRRRGRHAAHLEEPARRLRVHRVRALHGGLSGEHHRQAALAAQDRDQHAAAAAGARAGHRRRPRSGGQFVPGHARAGRGRRSAAPRVTGCSTTSSPRRSSGRARPAAPACTSARCPSISWRSSTRCGATSCSPSRVSRKKSSPRSSRSSATARRGRSSATIARMGRGPRHPDDGRAGRAGRAARRAVLGGLHGIVRRPREEDRGGVRAHPPGGRRPLRDPRTGGELSRRSCPPPGQRVPLPDAGETGDRDPRSLRGHHDRHQLPPLLPPDRQRVSAARRALRGHPPLDLHRRCSSAGPRSPRHRTSTSGSPWPITTAATSDATMASTTRRARRCGARCRS